MAWALYQLTRTAHGCGLMSHFTLMLWGCLSGKRFLTNGKCTVAFNLKNLEVILPYKSTKNPKSHFWLSSTEKPLLTQRTLSFKSKSLHHLWQVPQEQNPRPRFQCLDMCLRFFLHYLYTKPKPIHLQPLLFFQSGGKNSPSARLRQSFETAKGFVLQDHQRSSTVS